MHNKGFSLIEACIALIVIGLLMAPIIAEYNNHIDKLERDTTAANNFIIKSAIEAYYNKNGRYPCPASLFKKLGDEGYGQEHVISTATTCVPPGLLPGTCDDGLCLANATPPYPSQIIYGAVPFAELQMNEDKTFDGWGNRVSYALTVDMGRRAGAAVFPTKGSIYVEAIDKDTDAIVPKPEPAHYLIISHGNNGRGAFNKDGISTEAYIDTTNQKMLTPCIPNVDYDSKNCDNDGSYLVTNFRGSVVGDDRYYDDRVYDVYTTPSTAWNPAGVSKSISTGLMVGIGTREIGVKLDSSGDVVTDVSGMPEVYANRIGLDVADSIRADKLKTQQICSIDGSGCFSPNVLAGSGSIDCSSQGAGMIGIANSSAKCSANLTVSATPKTCSSGLVTGVVNGVIQCSP